MALGALPGGTIRAIPDGCRNMFRANPLEKPCSRWEERCQRNTFVGRNSQCQGASECNVLLVVYKRVDSSFTFVAAGRRRADGFEIRHNAKKRRLSYVRDCTAVLNDMVSRFAFRPVLWTPRRSHDMKSGTRGRSTLCSKLSSHELDQVFETAVRLLIPGRYCNPDIRFHVRVVPKAMGLDNKLVLLNCGCRIYTCARMYCGLVERSAFRPRDEPSCTTKHFLPKNSFGERQCTSISRRGTESKTRSQWGASANMPHTPGTLPNPPVAAPCSPWLDALPW